MYWLFLQGFYKTVHDRDCVHGVKLFDISTAVSNVLNHNFLYNQGLAHDRENHLKPSYYFIFFPNITMKKIIQHYS